MSWRGLTPAAQADELSPPSAVGMAIGADIPVLRNYCISTL